MVCAKNQDLQDAVVVLGYRGSWLSVVCQLSVVTLALMGNATYSDIAGCLQNNKSSLPRLSLHFLATTLG